MPLYVVDESGAYITGDKEGSEVLNVWAVQDLAQEFDDQAFDAGEDGYDVPKDAWSALSEEAKRSLIIVAQETADLDSEALWDIVDTYLMDNPYPIIGVRVDDVP